LITVAATACSGRPSEAVPRDWPLAEVTEHDVTVTLRAIVDDARETWVAATYTPTRAGFHLYSKDLALTGQSGIGRPTLLEVESSAALVPRGVVISDQKPVPLFVPVLKQSFPVYPEGPVTLRLPVTVTAGGDRRATFSVTYLACSESLCLAPVTRRPVAVVLPDRFVTPSPATPRVSALPDVKRTNSPVLAEGDEEAARSGG
jgi:hypothetical protein